jgi:hypothetical protein
MINRKYVKKLKHISIIVILDYWDLQKLSNSSIKIEKEPNNIENKKNFIKLKFDDILQNLEEFENNED